MSYHGREVNLLPASRSKSPSHQLLLPPTTPKEKKLNLMDKTGPPDSIFLTGYVQSPGNFNKQHKQNQVLTWFHLFSFYREVQTEIELFTKLQDLEGPGEKPVCQSEIHRAHISLKATVYLCYVPRISNK